MAKRVEDLAGRRHQGDDTARTPPPDRRGRRRSRVRARNSLRRHHLAGSIHRILRCRDQRHQHAVDAQGAHRDSRTLGTQPRRRTGRRAVPGHIRHQWFSRGRQRRTVPARSIRIRVQSSTSPGSSDRGGGFIQPSTAVNALSRKHGSVGDDGTTPGGIDSGTFNPANFLGSALPKLFGLFDLSEILISGWPADRGAQAHR